VQRLYFAHRQTVKVSALNSLTMLGTCTDSEAGSSAVLVAQNSHLVLLSIPSLAPIQPHKPPVKFQSINCRALTYDKLEFPVHLMNVSRQLDERFKAT
jgi:hypothetical protein